MTDPAFWAGRRVLLTGHTGFKGAWLALWLAELGAEVTGYALAPEAPDGLYEAARVGRRVRSVIADINDRAALNRAIAGSRPEVVLHLAAQSLVRRAYRDPVGTFATNVGGVVTLLDAVRGAPSVRAVVVATSDKCYEEAAAAEGHRETDRLGGRDPYSASKGCAEIAVAAMRRSFFGPDGHGARIATVRAGNVIGGGDWAEDRLVPDIVRGCLGADGVVRLRRPEAIRPWQHVLEPLAAYLALAERLAVAPDGMDEGWNIGPDPEGDRPVREVAAAMIAALGQGSIVAAEDPAAPHEAAILRLDSGKAKARLGWTPRLGFADAVRLTAGWYRAWRRGDDMEAFSLGQLAAYRAPP